MSSSADKTTWRQRALVLALALAAFGGFFLVGRAATDEGTAAPATPDASADRGAALPPASQLALGRRVPNLIVSEPREQKPKPPEPEPEPAAPIPAAEEEAAAPAETETSAPPAPPPAPPPPAAPPQPPPPSPPEPEPSEPPVVFDDSG